MKLCNQSVDIINIKPIMEEETILKKLERIGRVCYKSGDKITKDSAKKFVKMLLDHNHLAMMEHHHFIVKVTNIHQDIIWVSLCKMLCGATGMPNNSVKFINCSKHNDYILLSFSPTGLINLLSALTNDEVYIPIVICELYKFMNEKYPAIFPAPTNTTFILPRDYDDTFKESLELITLSPDNTFDNGINQDVLSTYLNHFYFSTKFICSRAIANEITRHRVASFAQESTRYCNYAKDKHNSEITFIETKNHPFETHEMMLLNHIENVYLANIDELDMKPQFARDLLPLATKTELVMTVSLEEIIHIIKLRGAKDAHPDVRDLILDLVSQLIEYDAIREIFLHLGVIKEVQKDA